MVVRQLAAFISGGVLTTFLIGPILMMTIPILLIAFIFMIILSFIVPGGSFFSWLTFRIASLPLHFKIGRFIFGLFIIALVGFVIGLALGAMAQQAFMFTSGGLVTLLSFTPPTVLNPSKTSPRPRTSELKVSNLKAKSLVGGELEMSDLRAGVFVTGEKCLDVARALVKSFIDSGMRVVVIGESSKILPEGVKVRGGVADKINVVEDMLNDHRCVESFAYAYSLANRLRNDDIPFIMNACLENILEVGSGRLNIEDFFKTLPDKIQDRRATLIKAVVSVTDWFSRDGLKLTEAEGDWQALYISVRNLPYRQAMFSMAYAILTLDLDAVLVIHSPELLVKDVNLLAYDSREPWERLFNALDDWKTRGLVLVSKSPILSPQILQLCQTHVASRITEYFRPLDEKARQIYEAARTLKEDEVVVYGSRGLFKLKLRIPNPANIPPPKRRTATTLLEGETVEELGETAGLEAVEPTMLEKLFGERVVDAARILEQAKSGLTSTSDSDKQLIRELEEKGFLTALGGSYYASATGEEALTDYQKAVRERGLIVKPATQLQEPQKPLEEAKQTVIDLERASPILGEHIATYYMAESLFRQGKYGQCIMNCYEFMLSVLKKFYQLEKGHLDDIVEMLARRGADTGLTIQEAKDAKTLLIEASQSVKEGRQVSLTSAQRMLRYARKVLEALQKIGGGESG